MRITDANDQTRRFRAWQDGVLVEDRDYTSEENAAADAGTTRTTRETNRTVLLDRAQTAIAANLTALTTAQTLENQASFTNGQRDDALRFLGRTVGSLIKQNNALIRLALSATRANALDSTE